MLWSTSSYNIFSTRDWSHSNTIEELIQRQEDLNAEFENLVVPAGNKIHALIKSSFEVISFIDLYQ